MKDDLQKRGVCTQCGGALISERKEGGRGSSQAMLFLVAMASTLVGYAYDQRFYIGSAIFFLGVFLVPDSSKRYRRCGECGHEWSV